MRLGRFGIALAALATIAASGPAGLEGRYRLVEQNYDGSRANLVENEPPLTLTLVRNGVALDATLTAGNSGERHPWPAFVTDAGALAVEPLERHDDEASCALHAKYRVRPSDDLTLEIVEDYRCADDGKALVGTYSVFFLAPLPRRRSLPARFVRAPPALRARAVKRFALALALVAASFAPAVAQVSGHAFDDRNGNGVWDAGEPALPGVGVELYGIKDAGGAFDQTAASAADGAFSFAPGNGCYLLLPTDPAGWRLAETRSDGFAESTPGYTFPVGKPRVAKLDLGIQNLKSGTFRFTAMGDSIAYNWNSCIFPSSFWYSKEVRSRIACAAPAAAVTLTQAAVKGQHTDDLLVDDTADGNNVFRAIESQPHLVTISMIGTTS